MKINVVGTSGSGKSTLAHRLAQQLNLPYIQMDQLYWRANWQGTPDEDFFTRVREALAAHPRGWVLDGNYNRTRPIKWQEVEYVVWLDYPLGRTFCQALRRAFTRAWRKTELWPGTGNRESFRQSFFSRESILLWTLKTWRSNRARYLADMQNPAWRHLRFVHLRSPAQAEAFLQSLRAEQKTPRG